MIRYMLKADPNAKDMADRLVEYLGSHNAFLSHGRRVNFVDLQSRGVKVRDIAEDPGLAKLVEASWYAIQHTFEGTRTFKMFTSSRGRNFLRFIQVVVVPQSVPHQS
jgi:hypothetical protein